MVSTGSFTPNPILKARLYFSSLGKLLVNDANSNDVDVFTSCIGHQSQIQYQHNYAADTAAFLQLPLPVSPRNPLGQLSLAASAGAEALPAEAERGRAGSAERQRQQRELCDGECAAAPLSLGKPSEPEPCREPGPAEQPRAALASYIYRGAILPAILAIPKLRYQRDFQLFLGVRLCSARRGKDAQRWHLCGNIDCGTSGREQMGHGQRGQEKPTGCARQLMQLARSGCEMRGERPRGRNHNCRNTLGSPSAFLG